MKVLIVSDTHNNISLFKKVLANNKFDMLFHLGDYYDDPHKADFAKYGKSFHRVPGIYHPGYLDHSLDGIETLDLSGFRISLVHSIDDINFTKVANQLIFYGHTHIQRLHKFDSNILINPGHLKARIDREQPASYIIMTFKDLEVLIEMYEVETGLVKTYKIIKHKDNKLELFI